MSTHEQLIESCEKVFFETDNNEDIINAIQTLASVLKKVIEELNEIHPDVN